MGFYLEENELLLGTETLGVYTGTDKIIPSYLVGFDLTIKSFEKAEKLKIKNILVPHYGLLNQKESAFYLEKGKENSVETANEILASLKAGVSKVQILEQFKEKYYVGYVKEIYPIDAMELNTNIMINLIERELME